MYWIDKRLKNILENNIDVEVSNFITRNVNKTMSKNSFESEYLIIDKENDNVSYNTKAINKYVENVSSEIEKNLILVENGKNLLFKTDKYKKIKNGIIYEVRLSSIRGSTLFSNIGPTIPVKLVYVGKIISNVDVETEKYGINNILVKLILTIKVKVNVSLPLTSKIQTIVVNEPLSIDIIKGKIPEYYKSS